MTSWRVMEVDWLNSCTGGLVDAEVKGSITCHRIPEIREIGVDEGQRPTFARDGAFKSINDRHIAFWVNVNDKDA